MDGLSFYLKIAGSTPLLTREKEFELGRRIQEGKLDDPDPATASPEEIAAVAEARRAAKEARETLIVHNLRLVISIAKKRKKYTKIPFDDLIEEGNCGLIRAADKYDYTRGYRFSTYATWWIKQFITRVTEDTEKMIRIPTNVTELLKKWYTAMRELKDEGKEGTDYQVQRRSKTPAKKMKFIRQAMKLRQLDIFNEFGEHVNIMNEVAKVEPADFALNDELANLMKFVNRLPPREAAVLRMRFGIGCKEDTLEEIGKEFRLTRERIRQIETRAKRRLKEWLEKSTI